MQENAREEQHREYPHRESHIAGQNEKHRLDLAMQKPLKHNQRHEHKDEPDQTGELGHGLICHCFVVTLAASRRSNLPLRLRSTEDHGLTPLSAKMIQPL